jgi:hypothetical protein
MEAATARWWTIWSTASRVGTARSCAGERNQRADHWHGACNRVAAMKMIHARCLIVAGVAALTTACANDPAPVQRQTLCDTVADHVMSLQAAERAQHGLEPLDAPQRARRRQRAIDRCAQPQVSQDLRDCLLRATDRDDVAACDAEEASVVSSRSSAASSQ